MLTTALLIALFALTAAVVIGVVVGSLRQTVTMVSELRAALVALDRTDAVRRAPVPARPVRPSRAVRSPARSPLAAVA